MNGNILNLHRNGNTDSSNTAIDRLQYSYSGNKLLSVTDTITWNPNVGDFRDGNTSGDDYIYWTDGSLKSDANKGISLIEYDSFLKKVKQVTYGNGNWIKWFYDGQGGLLKRENSSGTEWTYAGNVQFKNDTLYQIGFSGGRVLLDSSANFNYRFEYRDIWNNLRLEYTAEDSIVTIKQISDYVPLGFEFNQMICVKNNHFKYKNKERISDFSLGVDFFKFRVSDPVIGRFWQIDPLGEQFAYNSVYAFQENKFGRGVELEGAELREFGNWIDKKLGEFLSYTDVDDATVITTHFTRDGAAIHADGTPATSFDKKAAVVGAALPFMSGAAAGKLLKKVVSTLENGEKTATSSRAARREAMRDAGIPTSQQPVSQSKNKSGREYTYEVPKEGGGKQTKSVQEQTKDRSHQGQPHWEAGNTKADRDGNPRMNDYGRPKLDNNKSKVNY